MTRRVKVGTTADFTDGTLTAIDVDGVSVVIAHDAVGLCAARNKCPHLGLSLVSGPGGARFRDGVVQCPWHNSRFVVRTGENVDWTPGFAGRRAPGWSRKLIALGKKPAPLTTYRVVVEGEDVFVEL